MIKERYYILKEWKSSDFDLEYKIKHSVPNSDDYDHSLSTKIRTSNDLETEDGTTINNDEKLYNGSWDIYDDKSLSMNGGKFNNKNNNNESFLFKH